MHFQTQLIEKATYGAGYLTSAIALFEVSSWQDVKHRLLGSVNQSCVQCSLETYGDIASMPLPFKILFRLGGVAVVTGATGFLLRNKVVESFSSLPEKREQSAVDPEIWTM
jgi:hypothetical protein